MQHLKTGFLVFGFLTFVLSPISALSGEKAAAPPPPVKSEVAVSALKSLADQHMTELANSLKLLAASPDVQSANWTRIEPFLAQAGALTVDALNWFALPDGSYWSLENGKEKGNLKDRNYFPKLMKGEMVMGDLVISKATGKSAAIVAVPVLRDGKVVGALGASVYLDKLSAQLEKELRLDKTMIFYSIDQQPILGLVWDPSLIMADPKELGPEIVRAFDKIRSQKEGTVQYTFRGKKRSVIFSKSDVTGWWYAFGRIPEGREQAGAVPR